MNWRNYY